MRGRGYRVFGPGGTRTESHVVACAECGADDCRDAAHSGGCPLLTDLPRDEVFRRQREVFAGWAARHGRAAKAGAS